MFNEIADRKCDVLARCQHGVITRQQIYEAGISEDVLRRRVKSGRLVPIYPGILMPSSFPRTWLSDLHGAVLSFGPECLASGRSAGRLYGLDGINGRHVEVLVRTGRSLPGVISHRMTSGDCPTRRTIEGIPVTSVERTFLDLAGLVPLRTAGLCLDDALRRRLTTLGRLQKALSEDGGVGRKGSASLRKLLSIRDDRDALLRSKMEARALRTLKKIKREAVIPNHEVRYGGRRYFLDFAFPAHRVAVETDSLKWHFGEEKVSRDLARDRHLSLAGWTVLYFSWDEVMFHPEMVRSQTEEALERAHPQFGFSC